MLQIARTESGEMAVNASDAVENKQTKKRTVALKNVKSVCEYESLMPKTCMVALDLGLKHVMGFLILLNGLRTLAGALVITSCQQLI